MSSYPLTGPFSNGSSPGISATFLNNLETYLAYAADSNITADGSGNLSIVNTGHYQIGGINVMWSPSTQSLEINAPHVGGVGQLNFNVGGTRVAHIDVNGAMVLKGALTQNGTP